MFGSYSSYSSVSTMSTAIDISPSNLRTRDASCAFPSWPRRESLSEFDREERATSFLSDDDLLLSDPFDSDSHSIASSSASSSPIMMMQSPPRLTDAEVLEMQREKLALQRECMRQIMLEKERRKQASKKKSRSASSAKKSPKSKLVSMTPISE
ncbi:hypothetical protein THAR02_04718 [Trichoderma harzianum]|uniref:Uncharacterized protein n=4 Tax=Trichoderma TaxID=5543 RepID=A0A0G0ADV5_TRIHA|nr:hypothetical protein M431DRAFT_478953 [Trichoderma harzianum CBS 226.95]KAK0759947.1 hypothetical protein N5P37_007023 [Trichoderma harzianum]OPB43609.1 hypothetical protein A0O28_0098970 [Trichoderma guizhouense]QYS94203.1 hypothetical protein H0G86_001546 [Trichoderma simmonsii]KAK4076460.1 hypothetical protein Trihar35433_3020 [Trichoderma harzianum]KKP03199.1 hypothetical protein THAR02_04718 [Trichoderma harzianum]